MVQEGALPVADNNIKILFSDHFAREDENIAAALEAYGAFDVSLLADLPLFIDPFLLFNSKEEKYQELHENIIHYLTFLRDKSVDGSVTAGLRNAWYTFTEVKQTWLGFTVGGNEGRGLGAKFAQALDENFFRLFNNEEDSVKIGNHLEKLCLLGAGVGRDSISDFATNLISGYLAEYTQEFAKAHLTSEQCSNFYVEKASFNYKTEVWEASSFYLPRFKINFPKPKNDYVLLVPRNLLTRDDTWISQNDMIKSFPELHKAVPNETLRDSISNYLEKRLPELEDKKKHRKVFQETIQEFPTLIDYYISMKEATGDKAVASSNVKVKYAQAIFLENFTKLASLIFDKSDFYTHSFTTLADSLKRTTCLKRVIEDEGGYKFLYSDDGNPLTREEELAVAYHFIWFNTPSGEDVINPVDPKKAVPVLFKLAGSKALPTFLDKKNREAIKNKDKEDEAFRKSIIIIFYFSEEEKERVQSSVKIISEDIGHIVLIDASKTNRDADAQDGNAMATTEMTNDTPIPEPTKVFISYSHDRDVWKALGEDPDTQRKRVYELVERLRSEGVKCTIDQHIVSPSEGWPRWMMDQIEAADFVLVVATETYNRRFRGHQEPNKGQGAQWEGAVITQELYNLNGKNEKFIPIIFDHKDAVHIPLPLQGATYFNPNQPESYDELYYYLTNQPPYVPKPLGPIRVRPSRNP